MPDQLLNLLKLFLLLLLYLFFLRVLRAVWAEVNPPKVVESPPKPKREKGSRRAAVSRKHGPLALRLVAPPEVRGRSYPLTQEITVGRAAGCHSGEGIRPPLIKRSATLRVASGATSPGPADVARSFAPANPGSPG